MYELLTVLEKYHEFRWCKQHALSEYLQVIQGELNRMYIVVGTLQVENHASWKFNSTVS